MFNATSIREARKSTELNRIVLVFTVITAIYLPLGFVTVSPGLYLLGLEFSYEVDFSFFSF